MIMFAIALWIGITASGCAPSETIDLTPTAFSPQATAQALIENGDLEQAAQLLQEALEAEGESAAAHYQLGLIQAVTDPDQAAEQLEQALELDPDLRSQVDRMRIALRQATAVNDRAYQLTVTGQALSSIEEWPLAQAALQRAVEQDPKYAEAWAYLGEARQHNEQENSLDALQNAISLNPQSYAANLFMSIYWKRNQQPKRALPYLQTALDLDPNNLGLKEDLAHTLVQAGLVETGFELLEELTVQQPDNPEIWMMLARLSVENAIQVEEVGLPAARQAILLAPENAGATLLLGRAYLLTEDAILAERFLTKCIQLNPELADPHLYLAIIYLNQQDKQPAEPHLQTALTLAQSSGNDAIAEQANQFLERYFP